MKPIRNINPKVLVPGITGYYAHGKALTFGYVELTKGSVIPEHQHIHEQITYILEGQLNMVIDGNAYTLTAGMYHIIPSNVPHSAIAIVNSKVIDAFNPVREDYR